MTARFASITIEDLIHIPISHCWETYTQSQHVLNWNFASDDWHCPKAEQTFEVGGKFKNTMAAKDGSFSFDFEGTYTLIEPQEEIHYVLEDERRVEITFTAIGEHTHIQITFDAETQNPLEMQEQGWKAILTNYKKYAEKLASTNL